MYIYNTLTKEKELFKPIVPGKVSLYHCGPTVYWVQHIGNLRAVFFSDTVVRVFKYHNLETNLVRNYTDVGHLQGDNEGDADSGLDRMEAGSKRENLTPLEIASKYIDIYEKDISLIGALAPDHAPRATEHVKDMMVMVQSLLDKGFAYITGSAVYFDTSKLTDYTKLSGQKLDQLKSGAGYGGVTDNSKKNPADFSLWFFKTGAHEHALQTWDSPFISPETNSGFGFPGWHIECSAMSKRFLGNTFDVHMGGIEHIPVHHTNEIAQSESANGVPYVKYWLHNEHLLVDSVKMAKSSGTAYTLEDIILRDFSPKSLRFFFLQAHYRSKQNFTWEALDASSTAYNKLLKFIQSVDDVGIVSQNYKKKFLEKISDDFNTPSALAVVFEMMKDTSLSDKDKRATLLDFDQVLGLGLVGSKSVTEEIPKNILDLAQARQSAKESKKWTDADKLRVEIEKLGYKISDTADGFKLEKA